jgi:hypothetical protein
MPGAGRTRDGRQPQNGGPWRRPLPQTGVTIGCRSGGLRSRQKMPKGRASVKISEATRTTVSVPLPPGTGRAFRGWGSSAIKPARRAGSEGAIASARSSTAQKGLMRRQLSQVTCGFTCLSRLEISVTMPLAAELVMNVLIAEHCSWYPRTRLSSSQISPSSVSQTHKRCLEGGQGWRILGGK